VTSATVNFNTTGATGGNYEFRYFLNDSGSLMATTSPISISATQSVTLTVNGAVPPTNVTAAGGSTLTTQVAVSGATFAGDWVGLYRVGGPIGQVYEWKYLNGTQTRPGTGTANATVSFSMPMPAGNYEIRFYSNDSSTLIGTSSQLVSQQTGTIEVNGMVPPAGVSTVPGANLAVEVTISGSTFPADWIGLYTVGGGVGQHHAWMYLNGTQVLPLSGTSSANLNFTVPSTAGPFELRLYSNGTSTVIATSSTITTQSGTITVNGATPPAGLTVNAGATLTTDVVITGPNFAGDWVGLFPVGGSVGQWLEWKYLNGTQVPPGGGSASATVTFTAPSMPGAYQIRLYSNGSTTLVTTSSTITVSAAQTAAIAVNGVSPPTVVNAPAGSVVSAAVTITGPAYAGDWVGLFLVGGPSSSPIAWKYMNDSQTRPGSGTPSGTVTLQLPAPAGNYEVRVFSSDSLTLVGTSSTINAQ
jgi:hypothetical protein